MDGGQTERRTEESRPGPTPTPKLAVATTASGICSRGRDERERGRESVGGDGHGAGACFPSECMIDQGGRRTRLECCCHHQALCFRGKIGSIKDLLQNRVMCLWTGSLKLVGFPVKNKLLLLLQVYLNLTR